MFSCSLYITFKPNRGFFALASLSMSTVEEDHYYPTGDGSGGREASASAMSEGVSCLIRMERIPGGGLDCVINIALFLFPPSFGRREK